MGAKLIPVELTLQRNGALRYQLCVKVQRRPLKPVPLGRTAAFGEYRGERSFSSFC
ncbi:MAG: hypothetical protein AB4042_01845 [Leptolyngbyaceae cyanobacterium]